MSLTNHFTNRTLCIGLSPTRLACVVRNGDIFVRESAYQQPIAGTDRHWQPAISALDAYFLQEDRIGKELPVTVTLPSSWCRWLMVPWSDALLRSDKADIFLKAQFIGMYGDEAIGWTVATDDAPYGAPRLTCAIETNLLDRITQMVNVHKHSCRHIEPAISMALRSWDNSHQSGLRAYAIIDTGRLNLVVTIRGRIIRFHSQYFAHGWTIELARAWQRWTLREPELAGISEVVVIDLAGELNAETLPDLFKYVSIPTDDLEPGFSFAICGKA